jgi:hypothetical protein
VNNEGAQFIKFGNVVISTPYNVASDDYVIPINTSSLVSPLAILLPLVTPALKGRQIIIKDVGGNLSQTNQYANVTQNPVNTIDGVAGVPGIFKMDINYSSVTFTCDGSNGWWVW